MNTDNKSYILNRETGRIELHFTKEEYKALNKEQQQEIKRFYNFSGTAGAWVSKGKNNHYMAIQVAEKLGFTNGGAYEPEQQEQKEVVYSEIDINDIHTYTVDKDLQRREHDSHWITRRGEADRTKELQDTLAYYQEKAIELISTTDNERTIYNIKKSLQYFKKHYSEAFTNWLRAKAENPSWITTGRGNLNKSKYEKGLNRIDKYMHECVELIDGMKKRLSKFASEIRKDKESKVKQEVNNTTMELEFKTKNIEMKDYSKKLRAYVYGEYTICKNWGTFRIYKNGKEIHSMKTNETLQAAKKYVSYLVNQEQTVITQ